MKEYNLCVHNSHENNKLSPDNTEKAQAAFQIGKEYEKYIGSSFHIKQRKETENSKGNKIIRPSEGDM